MRRLAPLVAMLLAACSAGPTATPSADVHAGHDPQARRVMAALEQQLGVAFERQVADPTVSEIAPGVPAGPHLVLGRAPDGVEVDLVGIPVEQVSLSIPADDPEAGQVYLAHVRDLLHGPDRVYDWAAAMLACRSDPQRDCDQHFEQGNLLARFSEGGPDYVVVSFSRER